MIRKHRALALFLAVVALAPLALPAFYVTLLNYVGLATLVTLGLVLLTGVAGVVSFGQQAFVGIAAYTTAAVTVLMGLSPWAGLVAGLALTAAFALLLGAITLRLSGHYLSIVTIAWGIALYYLFGNLPGLGQYSGVDNVPAVSLAGWTLDTGRESYYLIWLATVAALLAARNLLDSRSGRAIRALRFRGVMAESFGVDTAALKLQVFLYAAVLAALSGWLYAHFLRFVSPHAFGVNAGIDYLFMAVIGGASQVWGALLGASVLTVLKEWLKDLLPALFQKSGNYEIVVFGVLMMLLLHRTRDGLVPAIARLLPAGAPRPRPPDAPALPRRTQPVRGQALLELRGVQKRFGGLLAVNEMSFAMTSGQILGLIGPNGAGKSTLFKLIVGLYPPTEGNILFDTVDITTERPYARVQRGMSIKMQAPSVFKELPVRQNIQTALQERLSGAERIAEEDRLLTLLNLAPDSGKLAGALSHGQQQWLEIGMALALKPQLLLLDEPTAGMSPEETYKTGELIKSFNAEGMTVLVVEHDMAFVRQVAQRVTVLHLGKIFARGNLESILQDEKVAEIYLGKTHAH